jgi:hypothetical protein
MQHQKVADLSLGRQSILLLERKGDIPLFQFVIAI